MHQNNNIHYLFKVILLTLVFALHTKVNAQEVRIIDNKGTLNRVNNNNVTTSATSPIAPVENDIWFDTNFTPFQIKIYVTDDLAVHGLTTPDWVILNTDNQNATAVNLSPALDVDDDTITETTVQEAIEDLANNNIYNRDGTLTGTTGSQRTMTMGTNELTFSSNLNTRSTLTLQKVNGSNDIGIAFRNPDNSYKSAISMPRNGTTNRLDFFSGDATLASGLTKTFSLLNNNQIEFSEYDDKSGSGSFINNSPNYFLGVNNDGLVVQINPNNVLENIYTSDGDLEANRTITTDGFELNILNTTSTRNTLTFNRNATSFETGIAFQNNGNFYDAAITMGSGVRGSLDFYSGDAFADVNSLEKTLSLHDDNQIEFSEYGTGAFQDTASATEYILGVQNDGQVLELDIDDVIYKGTTGSVFFADAIDGSITEDNDDLFFDDLNDRLFIGNSALTGTNTLNVGGATRTSGLNNSNGSATQPSYRFTNDSDTGIYSNLDDVLSLSTGGSNGITIADNQNVTIHTLPAGTTTDELVVADANGVLKKIAPSSLTLNGTPGSVFFADTDGSPTEDNPNFFWHNNNNTLSIGPRVALNPAEPIYRLYINGITRANIIENQNGSPTSPTYRFTGDDDTGMFRRGTDNLGFSAGGIEALNIIESGTTTVRVNQNLELDGPLLDGTTDSPGTAGQILSSTVTGTEWIDNIAETVTTLTQDTTTSVITYTNEDTTSTPTTAQVVSADTNNSITVGSDGGAFLSASAATTTGPVIYATGRNTSGNTGSITTFNSTITHSGTTGQYNVSFPDIGSTNYIIQLTAEDCGTGCSNITGTRNEPIVKYTNITQTGFTVIANGIHRDNGFFGNYDTASSNLGFMFTVIQLPTTTGGTTGGGGGTGTTPTQTLPNPATDIRINFFSDRLGDGDQEIQLNFAGTFSDPPITEIEIVISDVAYDQITGLVSNIGGTVTSNSGPNATNTGFTHVINVSGISLNVFGNMTIDFTPNITGIQNCNNNGCTGLSFFIN